jgi:nucleotide-binding universal stress UspA family protein
MKHILCPTDFSAVADNAIVFAAKLSKRLDATLHLINFQLLADLTPEEALMGRDLNLQAAQQAIDERALEVSRVFKISCYGQVTASVKSLAGELTREAPEYDLVVMGTNGEDTFTQYLLGSNAYQFINRSEVPVLVIPENCVYRETRKLVYAVDYWRSNELALARVVSFCQDLGCELVILQVMEASFSAKADGELKHVQDLILDTYSHRVSITFEVVHDDEIAKAIDISVLKTNADLLSLSTPHHGLASGLFHKSVVRALTKRARYPILVFGQ